MKQLRVYVDTSVIGGCFDAEFQVWSEALVDDFRRGRFRLVLSDVTRLEVRGAPPMVQELFEELIGFSEILTVTEEALNLLDLYEQRGILGMRFRNDMLHIALASVAETDALVSWNFRHIVRLDKIRLFGAVNIEQGYRTPAIRSPREVATHGEYD